MKCPHCCIGTLSKTHNKVYVCNFCQIDFSEWELVQNWGWDIADLKEVDTVSTLPTPLDEPLWWNVLERDDAYEMVGRMFMGIPEYNPNPILDLPYPIGQVGM